ncbi:hypothetical protein MTDSW087_04917 [Methylobacterium dankookense]|uniref:Uncharacterized protein n=2 Tax=Methylobacterium dankookense TaxID=560405 RepID=A0A564G528_9HYPH|nr:hypothetical protein IFDJLNFL_4612 [Methylobacterium dankookense]VUF15182.1 hypothetical protein MTDSW087_04917 [Methylobacterium dankookense]
MRSRISLQLTAYAICRRFCAPSQEEIDSTPWETVKKRWNVRATKLWSEVQNGTAADDLIMAVGPILPSIRLHTQMEEPVERRMTKLAGQHTLSAFAKSVRGFGPAGLAKVIAECGDPAAYRSPAALWKRMGLAVIDGQRQRRVKDKDLAIKMGYVAERRSAMWNVGGSVIGGMGRGPRPLVGEDVEAREDLTRYQKLFIARLRYLVQRGDVDEVTGKPRWSRPPVTDKKTGELRESFSTHAASEAKRYVEKRLLKDLWRAARGLNTSDDGEEAASSGHPDDHGSEGTPAAVGTVPGGGGGDDR